MIQRKQTIWLLIAALLNVGLFLFDLYRQRITGPDGIVITQTLRINENYPLMLIALFTIAFPVISIFLFKNRKKQRNMAWLSILANVGFVFAMIMYVKDFNTAEAATTSSGSYWVGSVLPIIAIIFLFLALSGIRKDDKLVKSLDRLR